MKWNKYENSLKNKKKLNLHHTFITLSKTIYNKSENVICYRLCHLIADTILGPPLCKYSKSLKKKKKKIKLIWKINNESKMKRFWKKQEFIKINEPVVKMK